MPNAAMLMIVPLMIWSARTDIDSHACTSDTRTPARIAKISAMRSAGLAPKNPVGVEPTIGTR